jgi:hypothetical protein
MVCPPATSEAEARWPRFGLVVVTTNSRRDYLDQMIRPQDVEVCNPHVSNFDWTGCLAGCEERWGPGGRWTGSGWSTRDFMGPLDGSDPNSPRSAWPVEIYTHITLCTNYAVWEWV